MYGCESWTLKKAERQRTDAFELWCWRRLLRVPWTQEEKGMIRDEIVGWHHQLNGHEFEQAPSVGGVMLPWRLLGRIFLCLFQLLVFSWQSLVFPGLYLASSQSLVSIAMWPSSLYVHFPLFSLINVSVIGFRAHSNLV